MATEIKNLKKAAQRILKAVKNKEKIILYGDADMDGVTSVILFQETLMNLGAEVSEIYFPDREEEGYGLNEKALDYLKEKAPALLIILDCGISNFEEIKLANKIGFEIIIVDHHVVLEKLPEAFLIVNPKQEGDEYPFKEFAASGLSFQICQVLLGEKLSENLKKNFLELVALATLADMMAEREENKIFIEKGLQYLKSTFRPGLKVFFTFPLIKNSPSLRDIAQKIISTLNLTVPQDHLNKTYLLLTTPSFSEAKTLASELLERAEAKRMKTREIYKEAEEKISSKREEPIVFEGDPFWPLVLTGSVASRVCNIHQKPTFIFKKEEKESRGAMRMPKGLDGVKALIACKESLITFGGHPPAGGFRLETKNLDEFKNCLIHYFNNLGEI